MEMETACRYNLPVKIVVFNNGGIGPGHAKHPDNPLQNLKPNALIYGARYDKMMEAFGGEGWFVENPKDLKNALQEATAFKGPALVNVMISQESARKPQQFPLRHRDRGRPLDRAARSSSRLPALSSQECYELLALGRVRDAVELHRGPGNGSARVGQERIEAVLRPLPAEVR